jgi:hypothetical protein
MYKGYCAMPVMVPLARLAAGAIVLVGILPTPEVGQDNLREVQFSRLWGRDGELWSPRSRLPDFSLAGYRRGEAPYRVPRERISVRDFGAVGDGKADDTAAFQEAFVRGGGKVIEIPPGRYLLTGLFSLTESHTVLRGAGSDRTVLVFQRPGEKLLPRPAKTDGNQPTTGWSWAGGLISIGGRAWPGKGEVPVTREQQRGDDRLRLASNPFRPGDEILLRLRDDEDKSLLQYLYRGQTGDISGLNAWQVSQVFRVREVDREEVILDRPLRFDVQLRWKPVVQEFAPGITDVGIEGICFDFPVEPYQGHFREVGWNPIEIGSNAAHCWLRDIVIRNADNGPFVGGYFCTVEEIRFEVDPERLSREGYCGHHGITFFGNDCLCRRFTFECRFIHDLTVQSAIGCVFAEGKGVDINFDHHRWAPYENLFTDIEVGRGTRVFASSGGGMRGNHTAAGATFWCIRSERPVPWPGHFGIEAINLVGVKAAFSGQTPQLLSSGEDSQGRWFEPIPPEKLYPANLWEAQKVRRTKLQK